MAQPRVPQTCLSISIFSRYLLKCGFLAPPRFADADLQGRGLGILLGRWGDDTPWILWACLVSDILPGGFRHVFILIRLCTNIQTGNTVAVYLGHLIQNLLSNQSRYNMLLVSQELEMMCSCKSAYSLGVSYLAFLAVFLSLYKACVILITCSVKYMQCHGQHILTTLLSSRASDASVTPSWQSDSDLGSSVCTWKWPPCFVNWRPSRQSCSFLLWELGTRKERFTCLSLGQRVRNQHTLGKTAFCCFHRSLQVHFPSLTQAVAKHFPVSHTQEDEQLKLLLWELSFLQILQIEFTALRGIQDSHF